MTALEASASTRTRAAIRAQAQIIDHVTVSDRLVHDVLLGWPARADSVRVVLDAARASGVDVATVPARTPAEVAAWLPKRRGATVRPCPACSAKEAELAEVRAHLVEQSRVWSEACDERDTARSEVTALRARVAELEAPTVAAVAALETRIAAEDSKPSPRPREKRVSLELDGRDLLAGEVA